MSTPVPIEPEPETTPALAPATDSPDPITGEPGAHPTAVGVGALSAGAAGAVIGAIAGPIGMLVGAAIGAVAGGLAGHEVAVAEDTPTTTSLDTPLPTASSGLITPDEESIFADSGSADSGVTGEAPLLTESALPAAFATTAEPAEPAVITSHGYAVHLDTEHTIRTAAYYRYAERTAVGEPGSDFEDWIAAEKDVLAR